MSDDTRTGPTAPRRLLALAARLPLGAIVALAIGVRLVAGVAFPAADTDTYEFGAIGRNVAEGRGFTYFHDPGRLHPDRIDPEARMFPSAHMPPVYTYIVAAATEVGGSHAGTVWAVRGANAVAAVAGVLLLERLARRLVGAPGARLAALGFAVYPALVYGATQVSAANVYIPVELGLLLLLLRAGDSPSWRRCAAAGLALGLLCLLRAEAVILVPAAAAWLLWASRRGTGRAERRAALPRVALFACLAALLPGAWIVRNAVTFGAPVVTVTSTGGMNLWMGNHEGATGSQKSVLVPPEINRRIRALPPGDDLELRRDAIFRREALDYMLEDPGGTVLRDVKKIGLLLIADVHDRRNLNPVYLGSYAVLAVLGTAGFARWWRARPPGDRTPWLLVGYLTSLVAVPVVFFALARYRLPIETVMLVFAGAWLGDQLRRTPEMAADHPRKPHETAARTADPVP